MLINIGNLCIWYLENPMDVHNVKPIVFINLTTSLHIAQKYCKKCHHTERILILLIFFKTLLENWVIFSHHLY